MADNLDTALWQNYTSGITGHLANPKDVICVNLIPASFDGKLPDALGQVYQFGNSMPQWRPDYTDSGSTFFDAYRGWLEALHPTGGTGDVSQLPVLLAKVTAARKAYQEQMMSVVKAWKAEGGASGLSSTLKEFIQSPANEIDLNDYLSAVIGASSAYDAAATKAYGTGYQALVEAKSLADAADPNSAASQSNLNAALQAQMQMTVTGADGNPQQVPRFGIGTPQLNQYQTWLAAAQAAQSNGLPPSRKITFSSSMTEKDASSYAFSGGAVIPIDDFFFVGGRTSGSGNSQSVQSESYQGTVTFQDVIALNVAPDASTWFNSGLLRTYANFSDWPAGSVYANTPIWGPNGILGTYVSQVIVGYAPSLEMSFDNWSSSKTHSQWTASTSFGIGPFTLGSATVSHSDDTYNFTETKNGIRVTDTTGVPKIIGLVMTTPNFTI